ncbi:hypothetical protein LXJ58_30165, partial [Escherichia coli]|nr:hypothetical protein [Escherichia coli]
SALILLVSFPAGMLPETFESRERIGASALQGGTCAAGEVQLNACALGKDLKIAGTGGPQDRKHSIPPYPKTRVPGTARHSHLLNGQTQKRAWQGEKLGTAAFQHAAD